MTTRAPGAFTIEQLLGLLAARGGEQYGGECITQLQHALQAATLAENEGAGPALIVAALFHDLGHLVHGLGENATREAVNDHHEARAVPYLKVVFGEEVWQPVRWHVQAKRYLCTMEPGYSKQLSDESVRSLALQGGAMSAAEADEFVCRPFAREAVQLRRWDDAAKDPTMQTPDLEYFARHTRSIAR